VLGKLEAAAHQVRASYLAAPVFGRPDAAQAATLVQVLGGENAAKELIKPLIVSAIARRVVDAGEDVAKGMTSHAAWKEADTGRVGTQAVGQQPHSRGGRDASRDLRPDRRDWF
jgi:hypothetical protein